MQEKRERGTCDESKESTGHAWRIVRVCNVMCRTWKRQSRGQRAGKSRV